MISVVVPIYNEQENLPELRRRLAAALQACGPDWEVVFVNDGSRDGSEALLRQYHREDPRFKSLLLSRNFGHQPAISAGLHHARGQAVVLIDGDLQDPPELIPELVQQWSAGNQVVLAERTRRAEGGLRGFGLRLFYPLMRRLSDLPSTPDAGIFGLLDRAVVDQLNRLGERHRFIPGLRAWLGYRQTSVPYERQARAAGEPKQSMRHLIRYAMDAMFSFSIKPLRAATYLGFLVSIVAFLLAVYYFLDFFIQHKPYGTGFTTIILCVLFLGGVQLICVGILGEYIGRIYDEVKQRPLFVVAEKIGID